MRAPRPLGERAGACGRFEGREEEEPDRKSASSRFPTLHFFASRRRSWTVRRAPRRSR
jgi:hypothetical protein